MMQGSCPGPCTGGGQLAILVPLPKRASLASGPYLLWGSSQREEGEAVFPILSGGQQAGKRMGTGEAHVLSWLQGGKWLTDLTGSPLLCPTLVWTQMIESGCFNDINKDEFDENTVLNLEEKMHYQVPKKKRGFFYRLLRRGVRVTSILLL